MDSLFLADYLRRIRTAHAVPALRAIAAELERDEPDDEATMPLLRMVALKVVRIERSN